MNPINAKNPPATTGASASSSDAPPVVGGVAELKPLKVAYHDGPPAIQYFGRRWERGAPQEVSPDDWAAMQERADFPPFQFKSA